MASKCPKCDKTVYFGRNRAGNKVARRRSSYEELSDNTGRTVNGALATVAEKVSSLGKDWHKFCLKCERCNKTLNPGGHAEHHGTPYCHKPCYAALFGPKGVNIGGGRFLRLRRSRQRSPGCRFNGNRCETRGAEKSPAGTGEGCKLLVFLRRTQHLPPMQQDRVLRKTLSAGSHAEPYCHKPCYAVLFGPKGVNTGGVGSYIYNEPEAEAQP
ncbi:hypothetical protein KUCAC02_013310 [Chaenocephalus aceratus]|nr:hypothetical protein KUCAC02_013310 [Chaenocephalus aceratus]